MCLCISSERVCLRLVCKAVEAHIKHLLQLFSFNQCTILNFHPFLKHLTFPYFGSDSIENFYSNFKSVEVVSYEVPRGYAALIEINDLLKVVPFFGAPYIISLLVS